MQVPRNVLLQAGRRPQHPSESDPWGPAERHGGEATLLTSSHPLHVCPVCGPLEQLHPHGAVHEWRYQEHSAGNEYC